MSSQKELITNYRYAWIKFKQTNEYKHLVTCLKNKNIAQPYRDNILMASFAAGWLATGKKIHILPGK
jgi:hypothetical protein